MTSPVQDVPRREGGGGGLQSARPRGAIKHMGKVGESLEAMIFKLKTNLKSKLLHPSRISTITPVAQSLNFKKKTN